MAPLAVAVFTCIALGSVAASPQSSPMEALGAIDTDGNGKASLAEIEAFGRTSGLTTQQIRADFKDLDSNSDGELDTQEMSGLLSASSSDPVAESAKATPSAKAEPVDPFAAVAKPVPIAAVEAKAPPAVATNAKLATAAYAYRSPTAANDLPLAQAESALPASTGSMPSAVQDQVPGLEALELNARQQAGAIIAEGLAKRAQVSIQQGERDAKEAEAIEAKAIHLRGSARAAAKSMGVEASRASEAAVHAAAKQGLAEAERLKQESEEFERDARQHHERAQRALLQAAQAQESTR